MNPSTHALDNYHNSHHDKTICQWTVAGLVKYGLLMIINNYETVLAHGWIKFRHGHAGNMYALSGYCFECSMFIVCAIWPYLSWKDQKEENFFYCLRSLTQAHRPNWCRKSVYFRRSPASLARWFFEEHSSSLSRPSLALLDQPLNWYSYFATFWYFPSLTLRTPHRHPKMHKTLTAFGQLKKEASIPEHWQF